MGDRDVRRVVLGAGLMTVLCGCGSAAQTARNPEPSSSPPRVHAAHIGDAILLTGADTPGGTGTLKIAVKVQEVISHATGRGAFENPRKGERFAAVRFVFKNVGAIGYHDSPTFGAKVTDSGGHGYDPTVATVSAGAGFPRVMSMRYGQVRTGLIVFAVPKKARILTVQYALNAGYAPELGEWRVPQERIGEATAVARPPRPHGRDDTPPRPGRSPRPPRWTWDPRHWRHSSGPSKRDGPEG
jgi:Domain of unknown function (DUF4352)